MCKYDTRWDDNYNQQAKAMLLRNLLTSYISCGGDVGATSPDPYRRGNFLIGIAEGDILLIFAVSKIFSEKKLIVMRETLRKNLFSPF